MKNILTDFEDRQITRLTSKKKIPKFRTGDTLKVNVKVVEGERSRIQVFEGICIARKNAGLNTSFTVRKISSGEGVERIFPLFSPIVDSIEIIRQGDIRRSKLYYLRKRSGKSARIATKDRGDEMDEYLSSDEDLNNQENKTGIDKKIVETKDDESNNGTDKDKEKSEKNLVHEKKDESNK